jgi:hypothetical protein
MVQETCGMSYYAHPFRATMCGANVLSRYHSLKKEEKTHDDRIANANAKIKQAGTSVLCGAIACASTLASGQSYEKKAKRNAIDASEEHNRHINLLNTLGPEISQAK